MYTINIYAGQPAFSFIFRQSIDLVPEARLRADRQGGKEESTPNNQQPTTNIQAAEEAGRMRLIETLLQKKWLFVVAVL